MSKKVILFFVTIYSLGVSVVFCYDNINTHPQLTRGAVQVYNNSVGTNKINSEQANWIEYGAVNEDTDPRYLNHFYNPKTGQGLKDGFWSGVSAKKWAYSQTSMTGDYDYQTILDNYKEGNKKRAWQGVGHILHLIQDMTVPAHVRIDAHPEGDSYEAWAQKFGSIDAGKVSKSSVGNLGQVFDILATYAYDNFYSKDTLDFYKLSKYSIKKEIYKDGIEKEYVVGMINGVEYKIVEVDRSGMLPVYEINNIYVNQSYWNLLSPKAISYSAGVIELFVNEFKKIDDQKAAELAGMSLLQKLSNGLKDLTKPLITFSDAAYVWGDAFMAIRPAAATTIETVASTVKGEAAAMLAAVKLTGSVVQTGGELVVDTGKTVGGQVVDTTKTVGDKLAVVGGEVKGVFISAIEEKKPTVIISTTITASTKTTALQSKIMTPVEVKVARVIDGDTIELVTGEKVRYIGVNAPELNGVGSADDECLAWATKMRNEQLIQSGTVRLVGDAGADKDAYGRLLRYVYVGNTFVNGQLAKEGFVESFFCQAGWNNCPVMTDATRKKIILDAANSAMSNKRGIYSAVCSPKEELVLKKSEPIFVVENETQPITQELAKDVQIFFGNGRGDSPVVIEDVMIVLDDGVDDDEEIATTTEEIATTTDEVASTTSEVATSTEEIASSTEEIATTTEEIATTTEEVASSTEEVATTTEEIASSTGKVATTTEDVATTTPEIDDEEEDSDYQADHVVISEIQVGTNYSTVEEFIELYNPTDADIDISNYRLTRKTKSGAEYNLISAFSNSSARIIRGHGFYLISRGYMIYYNGVPMMYSNISYTNSGASIADDNTVILYSDAGETIVDKVGYGDVIDFEGEPFSNVPIGSSIERKYLINSTYESMSDRSMERDLGNGYDSENNANDFIIRINPNPQSRSYPKEPR